MSTPSPHRARVQLDALPLRALLVCALVLGEVLVGQLAVFYSPPGTAVAMFWPNAGISVVALVVARHSWRPAVLAGIGAAVVAANLLGGRPLDVSLAYGLLNVASAAIALWVLSRGGKHRPELQGFEDCVRLVAAGLAGGLTSAVVGAAAMSLLEAADPI
jgi:integral membrane sensor domain MASE1